MTLPPESATPGNLVASSGPLNGLRVVDMSVTLPGPFCTQMMCRLGATVIQLEPPAGDSLRWVAPASFTYLAAGKQSVVVDLKDSDDQALARALLAEADIVVEGWRPGVADRLGVGYEEVVATNPGVVYCSLSGYGPTGDLAQRPGHDINYLAEAGALNLARPDGLPVGDLAGATTAAFHVLAELMAAQRTGQGTHLELSITGALSEWVNALGGSAYRDFLGVYQAPHYGTFPTADGGTLILGVAQEQHLWANLIRALGRPEWCPLTHDQRTLRRDEITAYLTTKIAAMTTQALTDLFEPVDTCWSLARPPGSPHHFTGTLPAPPGAPPTINQHGPTQRHRLGFPPR
ncbi:CaiB/BaiF CoA-transferase family protein [Streptosporangium sp. NPDC006013]|uniref:CaiB/BaiF CoA transferase family protein n=1 Tax=Streptosporangium sp. NPDC006013 TaxID=3155596 RepID=UPI0033A951DD